MVWAKLGLHVGDTSVTAPSETSLAMNDNTLLVPSTADA